MERENLEKNKLLNQLTKIGHGDLSIYTDIGLQAAKHEPFLFAHFVAWNQKNNRVRDSKVAFPVLGLRSREPQFLENAAANLCLQAPRELLRACYYHKQLPIGGSNWLKQATIRYLRERERYSKWWDKTALQHRKALKGLYALNHIKPSFRAQQVLFKNEYPKNSVFAVLPQLKNMTPSEAAGNVLNFQIPFNIAIGAVPSMKEGPDIALALIERMTGSELINNAKAITSSKAFALPAVKASFEAALERAKKDTRVSSLKAGVAAKAVSGPTREKLQKAQTEQLNKQAGKIPGNWLILGDRSGSMQVSIEISKQLSSLLAERVEGMVILTMFNHFPIDFNVTGKSLDEIEALLSGVYADGGTSIGCGLVGKKNLDGIVIVSDGGQQHGIDFWTALNRFENSEGYVPVVYLLHAPGDPNFLLHEKPRSREIEVFEFQRDFDYYSLPNIVKLIRPNTFELLQEVLGTSLITLDDVFKKGETR